MAAGATEHLQVAGKNDFRGHLLRSGHHDFAPLGQAAHQIFCTQAALYPSGIRKFGSTGPPVLRACLRCGLRSLVSGGRGESTAVCVGARGMRILAIPSRPKHVPEEDCPAAAARHKALFGPRSRSGRRHATPPPPFFWRVGHPVHQNFGQWDNSPCPFISGGTDENHFCPPLVIYRCAVTLVGSWFAK